MEVLTLQGLLSREPDLARPERPSFHLLALVTRGEGSHTIDFVRYRLRAGTVLHVAPGQVQAFSGAKGLDAWLLVFQADFVRVPPSGPAAPLRLSGDRLATVRALFEAAAREYAAFDGSEAGKALLRGLVETIGLAVNGGAPVMTEAQQLLRRFRAALERTFRRAHEVTAYAAILRCSTRTLTRHCERGAGKSAKRLIDERVALEAKRTLAHGDQSIAELSHELGFGEPTQFTKFFRRLTGETPARFRARLRASKV